MAIALDSYTSYPSTGGAVATHSFNHSVNSVSKSIVVSLNTSRDIYGGAVSYSGCAATGAIDAVGSAEASGGTTVTASTTTIANNCWIAGVTSSGTGRTMSDGTGTTVRFTNSGAVAMHDTNGAKSPAGAYNQVISYNSGESVGFMLTGSVDPGTAHALFVGLMHYTNSNDIVTGVTFNGVAMTRIGTGASGNTRTYLYFLRSANTVSPSTSVSTSVSSSISLSPSSSVSPSTSISNSPSSSVSPSTSISGSASSSISLSVSTSVSSSISTSISSSPSVSISPSPSPALWTERTKPTTAWTRDR